MIGLALAGSGAGWLFDQPWLIVLWLAIGGEGTLESSIMHFALTRGPRSTDYRRALNRSLRREPGQRTELLHLLDVRICVHTQEVEPLAPVHIPQERVVRLHIEAVGLD